MILGTSGRYLSGMLLKRMIFIALGLSLLLVLFDVLNNNDTIEKKYGESLLAIGRYMVLRLPELMLLVTPFSILVAALLSLLGPAAQNEALAFKAAGMSFYRMLLLMMPAVTLFAGFHYANADLLTPFAKRHGRKRAADITPAIVTAFARKPTWATSTRHNAIAAVTAAFRWAAGDGRLIARNPIQGI